MDLNQPNRHFTIKYNGLIKEEIYGRRDSR